VGVLGEKKREGRGIYRRPRLALGAWISEMGTESDGGGDWRVWGGLVGTKRCLTGGAHLSVASRRGWRTYSGASASGAWAGFGDWAKTAPPALFLFFCSSFSVFETKTLFCKQFCMDLNPFKLATMFQKDQRLWDR
jgi:hypothetical protein